MKKDVVVIDGKEYVPKVPPKEGSRYLVILDRGYIYAGDVETVEMEGRPYIHIKDAIMLRRWETIGLEGVLKNPKSANVDLSPMGHDIYSPVGVELQRIPVPKDWGI